MNNFEKNKVIKIPILDIFISLLVPLVLFLPYFLSKTPQNLFWGDTAILYFPQFVEGKHLFSKSIFYGVDFLTNNGASVYFLRPNLPTYYPIYYISYILFPVENLSSIARVFVGIWYFHGVLATYFCLIFAKKHLHICWQSSVLFAILYFGAISRFSFFMPVFYYVAALFPMLIYSSLCSVKATNKLSYLFYSVPYFLVFLCGYLPLDINAILISLIYTSIYIFFLNKKVLDREFINKILKILIPFLIAAIVVFPLYIAILRYHNLVPGLPPGVWQAAHERAYQSADLLRIISSAFMQFRPQEEWPHVTLGIIPIFLLYLSCHLHKKIKINKNKIIILNLSLFIFLFYLILSFGPYTGLSDIFYNVVPGLGKMHYYGRFLLVASFFLFAAIAIVFSPILNYRASIDHRKILYFILISSVTIFFLEKYLNLNKMLDINSSLIIFQFFLLAIVIFSLKSNYQPIPVAVIILLTFLIQAGDFNSPVSSFNAANPPPYVNTISNAPARQALLIDYFKTHSQKELIKYVDTTDTVEKLEGVGPNYPWIAQGSIKISNYMGYELNTSVDKSYIQLFPYYGRVNFPWILLTGADFIIYKKSQPSYSIELNDWIDQSVPQLDLGFNYVVAKLKTENGFLTGLPFGSGKVFNNGLIRGYSNNSDLEIANFQTDFASKVDFEISSAEPAIINFLLFPNKLMNLYINGEKISKNYNNGLLELKLPSGDFSISYRYKNTFQNIFLYMYFSYIVIIILTVIYLFIFKFKDKLYFSKRFTYL